jgi:hypothetical protein
MEDPTAHYPRFPVRQRVQLKSWAELIPLPDSDSDGENSDSSVIYNSDTEDKSIPFPELDHEIQEQKNKPVLPLVIKREITARRPPARSRRFSSSSNLPMPRGAKRRADQVPGLSGIQGGKKRALSTEVFNEQMALVVGMITDPEDFDPVRMRDQYSVAKTAITKPKSNYKILWDPKSTEADPTQLPKSDWAAFIFRDPIRSAVIYTINSTTAPNFLYEAIFNFGNNSKTTPIAKTESKDIKPVLMQSTAANTNEIHGPYLGCGEAQGKVGFWIDGDGTNPADVTFTFTMVTGQTQVAGEKMGITPYKWQGGIWLERTTIFGTTLASPNTTFTASLSVTESGYYAFFINAAGVTLNYDVGFVYTGKCATVWAHFPMGDIFPYNVAQINGLRTLAVGVLLKNEASPLTQQGNLIMLQASGSEDWYETYAAQNTKFYDYCFDTASEKDFLLKDGGYAYLKPTSEGDLAFILDIKHGLTGGGYGSVSSLWFPLEGQSDYLIFAASAAVSGAGDCVLKIRWAVEFKTQNNWLETLPPEVLPAAFSDGMEAVASMQQFFENPWHWKDIFRTIGKVAKVGAPILAQLGPYGVAGSAVLNGIGAGAEAL